MRRIAARPPRPQRSTQRGQVLLVILAILGIGFGVAFYTFVSPKSSSIDRDKITAAALARAKEALIGYAASVDVSPFCGSPPNCLRMGDLPCPDTNDSGLKGTSCGNAAGTTGQTSRIGRLPWKSLGLPDLRDGDGERLWYAVSNNFKYNTRTTCAAPGDAGCLNSDTRGTITVRDSSGNVINDGSNPDPFTPSGVIAVIFAPGAVLQRQGAANAQDRSCTGGSCTAAGICTSSPLTNTAKCNPINYLDVLTGVEDNADFTDSSNSNGFINGVIRDAAGNTIVNDRLITITYQDLMPVLQRRVAKEVINCLTTYASLLQNSGRYPWAAPVTDVSPPYVDATNTRFGRVPDTLSNTGGTGSMCPGNSNCMSSSWPVSCSITQGNWWTNWKEMVFYGLASAYAPASPTGSWWSGYGPVPAGGPCGGGSECLLVNPPSAAIDKRVVVAVAGKRLSGVAGGQPRTSTANKQDPAHYLEGTNDNTATSYTYEVQPMSASFNDFLLYQ